MTIQIVPWLVHNHTFRFVSCLTRYPVPGRARIRLSRPARWKPCPSRYSRISLIFRSSNWPLYIIEYLTSKLKFYYTVVYFLFLVESDFFLNLAIFNWSQREIYSAGQIFSLSTFSLIPSFFLYCLLFPVGSPCSYLQLSSNLISLFLPYVVKYLPLIKRGNFNAFTN